MSYRFGSAPKSAPAGRTHTLLIFTAKTQRRQVTQINPRVEASFVDSARLTNAKMSYDVGQPGRHFSTPTLQHITSTLLVQNPQHLIQFQQRLYRADRVDINLTQQLLDVAEARVGFEKA